MKPVPRACVFSLVAAFSVSVLSACSILLPSGKDDISIALDSQRTLEAILEESTGSPVAAEPGTSVYFSDRSCGIFCTYTIAGAKYALPPEDLPAVLDYIREQEGNWTAVTPLRESYEESPPTAEYTQCLESMQQMNNVTCAWEADLGLIVRITKDNDSMSPVTIWVEGATL